MGSGAKGQTGVKDYRKPLPLIVLRQPVGQYQQLLPNLLGRIVFFPALVPVGIGQLRNGQGQPGGGGVVLYAPEIFCIGIL